MHSLRSGTLLGVFAELAFSRSLTLVDTEALNVCAPRFSVGAVRFSPNRCTGRERDVYLWSGCISGGCQQNDRSAARKKRLQRKAEVRLSPGFIFRMKI